TRRSSDLGGSRAKPDAGSASRGDRLPRAAPALALAIGVLVLTLRVFLAPALCPVVVNHHVPILPMCRGRNLPPGDLARTSLGDGVDSILGQSIGLVYSGVMPTCQPLSRYEHARAVTCAAGYARPVNCFTGVERLRFERPSSAGVVGVLVIVRGVSILVRDIKRAIADDVELVEQRVA